MSLDKNYQALIEQITIWCPVHDLISGNPAYERDALDYFTERYKSPFRPPLWIREVFKKIEPREIEALKRSSSNQEAYEYLIWLRSKQRRNAVLDKEPETGKNRAKVGRPGGRSSLTAAEREERALLGPTMTAEEFKEHFNLKKLSSVYIWCRNNGVKLKVGR